MSPAKVTKVEVFPRHVAKVYVPEDQLSLAIGKNGQNVRLAAKLTGWKIDVRSPKEKMEYNETENVSEINPTSETSDNQ